MSPNLSHAAESSVALIIARIVAPAIMTVGLGVGAWIGNAVYGELKALRADITNVLVEQGKQEIRLDEHDRRLNRMESPRINPGVFRQPDYGGQR